MFYPELPDDLIREIAANTNYKDLPSMCRISRIYYETLCNNNYFWKLKTYYDFEDFYDIEPTTNVYGVADLYGDIGTKLTNITEVSFLKNLSKHLQRISQI